MSLSVAFNWLWNFGIDYTIWHFVNKEPGFTGLEVKVFFIWGSTVRWMFLVYLLLRSQGQFVRSLVIIEKPTRLSLFCFSDEGIIPRRGRSPVPEHHPRAFGLLSPTTET